jgi:hypothetical protein
MEYSKIIYSSIIIVVLVLLVLSTTSAPGVFAANDSIIINVTITQFTQISVLPDSITFADLLPGGESGYINVSVKNIGSANVTVIYVYTSTIADEATSPLGSGNASSYASTGFIFLQNSTAENHTHAGRLEWNLSNILQNETLDLDSGTTQFIHGFYRNASYGDYLFKVENGSAGLCNNSGAAMKIIDTPENGSTQHRDFSTESTTADNTIDASNQYWGIFSFTAGPLLDHCVAVDSGCTKIFIYKYDQRSNFTGCDNDASFDTTTLTPGNEINGTLYASIPQGTPQGQAIVGTLTINAA